MKNKKFRIGIDIGGTNIEFVLLSSCADKTDDAVFSHTKYPRGASGNELASHIKSAADLMLSENNLSVDDLESVGLAMPGNLDTENGTVIHAYNLNLHDFPIVAELKNIFPCKRMVLLNDADAAAYGEYRFGALRGYESGCLITLGTGVGAGLIIEGKLYIGGKKRGTEFGHMTLDIDGVSCTCKNKGCVETLCSATYIEKIGRESFDDNTMSAKRIFELAKNGNKKAIDIFDSYVNNLSSAIAGYMALLDPEVVALGGGVSLAGDFLLEPLKTAVEKKCFFSPIGKIVISKLQDKAGVIGAAFS